MRISKVFRLKIRILVSLFVIEWISLRIYRIIKLFYDLDL